MKQLLTCLLCILLFTGCDGGIREPEKNPENVGDASFQLYYGNENGDALLSSPVRTNEITEETVLASLIAQGVLTEDTELNSLKRQGDLLYLDFNGAFQNHLCTMGTTGESMLIGSVVNTFLGAFGGDAAVITVEGNTLESGHEIYDEPIAFRE